MSYTYTNSYSNTYTEARARYVMGKIEDDFRALVHRGFTYASPERLQKWKEDLLYVMHKKALEKFELQFRAQDGRTWGMRYEVSSDGSISVDSDSGGTDYWVIPKDARVGVIMSRDQKNAAVTEYLRNRGWTSGGEYLSGSETTHGGYSKDEYGVHRKKIGDWE